MAIALRKGAIKIDKQAQVPSYTATGDVIPYELTVTNTGNVTLTDVEVRDPLTGLDQNIGQLAPGQVQTLSTSYTVDQTDVDNGLLNNTANVAATTPANLQVVAKDSDVVTATLNQALI
ncbi:hypothetical protein V8V91_17870 [Algoriphagus halophilus]|uniref:DUF7507 domain-containing protein n=1 Tax=Algoriphagus halophilus TaxID=226505 RepID=UPI00358F2A0C